MKPERNNPGASERTEILVIVDLAQSATSPLSIDKDLRFRRRNDLPIRICALRRKETALLRQRIKEPDRSCRGKIGGEEAEVETRLAGRRAGKAEGKRACRARASKSRDAAARPADAARPGATGNHRARSPRRNRPPSCRVSRRIGVFVEVRVIEISPNEPAIFEQ